MIRIIFLALLGPFPAHADGGGFLDPDRAHPVCHREEVNSCINDNRNDAGKSRAAAMALDPKIQAAQESLKPVEEAIQQSDVKIEALRASAALSAKEIEFTKQPPTKATAEIFPGFSSLEDLFLLAPLEKNWLDRFPEARAERLTDDLEKAEADLDEEMAQLGVTQQNFASLNQQLASLEASKNASLNDASQHDSMCQSGCLQRFCHGP